MSNIQWTDISVNPIHIVREDGSNGGHFCRKVSPGCLHCYSEAQNQSGYFNFASKLPYAGKAPNNLIFDDAVMEKLLRMRSGKKVFLCSMTDLFGDWVPDEWIDKVFAYMAFSVQHTFQVLTKRPERMQRYLSDPTTVERIEEAGYCFTHNMDCINTWPLPNVWLGTSIENQEVVDQRIPLLLETPAAIRFLSCEPLLEPVDLSNYLSDFLWPSPDGKYLPGINWVITGGESGSKSRPCHRNWIESIVTQCQKHSVAVFVKQWGQNPLTYIAGSSQEVKLKDRKGGDMAEWPENIRVRQFPIVQK